MNHFKHFFLMAATTASLLTSSAYSHLTITPAPAPSSRPAVAQPSSSAAPAQLQVDKDGKVSMVGAPAGLTITSAGPEKSAVNKAAPLLTPSKEMVDQYSFASTWGSLSAIALALILAVWGRRNKAKLSQMDETPVEGSAFKQGWKQQRALKAKAKRDRKYKATIRLMG